MKFLHTADWQIGMNAVHVAQVGDRLREQRFKTAMKVIEEAKRANVEFILIAGDIFENNAVDRMSIQKVVDILSEARMPIYLIPGNHDPLVPGSVWEHPAWKESPWIHVLTESVPVEIPGGVLFPCPIQDKYSKKDPTDWIPKGSGTEIRIGMAHGTVEGVPQEEVHHPISRHASQRLGLDYLALGHWHSVAKYPGPDGIVRMAYSGTPEPTAFGERKSGNVLVVEIDAPGASPRIETVRTGALEWLVIERDLRGVGELSSVRREIEGIENPSCVLLDLRLQGLIGPEDRAELQRIQEIVSSRLLYGNIDTSGLRPSPQDARWIEMLPDGIIRSAAQKLQQLADPSFSGARPEGATPEVASRALIELFALVSERW